MKPWDYQHIIWDWNGTLLDDVGLTLDVMNKLLSKRNMPPLALDKYLEIFDFPVIDYYTRLGFDFSLEPFEDISKEFIIEYDNLCLSCKLHTDAEKILQAFSKAGIPQSILSAAHQQALERVVGHYNIRSYFTRLIGLDNIHAKGKIENGIQWIKTLGLAPHRVLLIGDTVHDYEAARAMGCDCILVSAGHHHVKRLHACGVRVFDSLEDILQDSFRHFDV